MHDAERDTSILFILIRSCLFYSKKLQEALSRYITDTLTYIHTVREFCGRFSKWTLRRETELQMMMDIKDRADKISLDLSHFTQSEDKGKAFVEYMGNKFTQFNADSKRKELEEELAAVLKDVLGGLEKLDCFLDVVEKLAVTSLHVFTENDMLNLPEEISLDHVQAVIAAARRICPLLLEFKRDASVFFLRRLQNADVMAYQLDRYVQTSRKICEKMEKSCFSDFSLKTVQEVAVELRRGLTERNIRQMLDHINQLDDIRMDTHFRMVFLFQEDSYHSFMKEFSERQPRMLRSLTELEGNAVQLDRMSKGAKISSVAGSSVGVVGGVLSIAGLALIPVTAGVSLALTTTGLGLGVTSGVNSIVTTATQVGVNHTQQKKAGEVLQSFMEDVTKLQDSLDEVTRQAISSRLDLAWGVGKLLFKVFTVARGIDSFVDGCLAVEVLKSEELISGAGKVLAQEDKALRNVPWVASDIPEVGQAAAEGSLAASQTVRAGLIAANGLFIGMDIFFICKDSISLAKGSETKVSQFIRARAGLWCSEMSSWKKIYNSLCEGLLTSGKKEAVLETPFYRDAAPENQRERNVRLGRWRKNGRKKRAFTKRAKQQPPAAFPFIVNVLPPCKGAGSLYPVCPKAGSLYPVCPEAGSLYPVCPEAGSSYPVCP
ncbi:uncharacterized protein LOC133422566 [Cololabis saira]|uniref:uncharacterized protein LOC133422566 n=1 Tax=Cololabis saira TaxID=129043 RepID=UPI002AD4386F|nr:uncharacterized protein LOC133422566 [Cololabis saira]